MGQVESQPNRPNRPRTDSQPCKKEQQNLDEAVRQYNDALAAHDRRWGNEQAGSLKQMQTDLQNLETRKRAAISAHTALRRCEEKNRTPTA
jgi:hypothetical protein